MLAAVDGGFSWIAGAKHVDARRWYPQGVDDGEQVPGPLF